MLFHQVVRPEGSNVEPSRWIYLLHGILGQGGNLRTVARRWLRHRQDTGAVLVDLRNHGRSLEETPPDTLEACAADLGVLAAELGSTPEVVLGHSFGGKVAMQYAADRARAGTPLEQLWVLDSVPGTRAPDEIDVGPLATETIVKALEDLPRSLPTREAFSERLEAHGLPKPIVAWLTMNVVRGADAGFSFGPDLARIRAMLRSYFETDLWPVFEDPAAKRTHVVVAGKSTTFRAEERERLRRASETHASVHMHLLPDSGHWVHVDAAEALDALLADASKA